LLKSAFYRIRMSIFRILSISVQHFWAELLKLTALMRETAAQLPEDIREGVIIDIEDVETEVEKPENEWNKARLKKSLTALVALAGILGTGVGGAIDIANNAIDVGQKLGIELKLPSGR
ncbi:hypothetical protein QUA00_22085, partial [Microcoleus sp. T2B6]|uniref:hypothetical protein n=1 Tax=Microcoleus sp. T2B6 TaxID=3055424 RepID=UPI002FCEF16D